MEDSNAFRTPYRADCVLCKLHNCKMHLPFWIQPDATQQRKENAVGVELSFSTLIRHPKLYDIFSMIGTFSSSCVPPKIAHLEVPDTNPIDIYFVPILARTNDHLRHIREISDNIIVANVQLADSFPIVTPQHIDTEESCIVRREDGHYFPYICKVKNRLDTDDHAQKADYVRKAVAILNALRTLPEAKANVRGYIQSNMMEEGDDPILESVRLISKYYVKPKSEITSGKVKNCNGMYHVMTEPKYGQYERCSVGWPSFFELEPEYGRSIYRDLAERAEMLFNKLVPLIYTNRNWCR